MLPAGLWLLSDSNPDREVLWRLGERGWAPTCIVRLTLPR